MTSNDDDDPIMTFDLEEIRRETKTGLCVMICDDLVWIPKEDCELDGNTITMRRSIAKRHFVI